MLCEIGHVGEEFNQLAAFIHPEDERKIQPFLNVTMNALLI